MPPGDAEGRHWQIWCPYCEKTTDHRLSFVSPRRQAPATEQVLEPADPPLGTRHIVTCLSCDLLHSWWARPRSS